MPISQGTSSADSVAQHVAEAWFPINKANLEEIRNSIRNDRYAGRVINLIPDLKTDSSLYLLCVRKLAELAQGGGKKQISPGELFRNTEYETLKQILMSDLEGASNHKLDSMTDIQAARLREGLISASSAEVLAEKSSIDPELGFSCALLRQLGLTLIAWNYPHVYARALQSLTPTSSRLDLEIQKILGFSPTTLAVHVTKDWSLAPAVRQIMGEDLKNTPVEMTSDERTIAENLSRLCGIGEALARANDPENYPTALGDWEKAEAAIKKELGSEGMQSIRELINQNLRAYARRSPIAFTLPVADNLPALISSSNFARKLLEDNKYIEQCPPLLKLQIKELYSTFSPTEISRDSVHKLVKDIIPSAGFERGCVFMLEPASLTLAPVLKIGDISDARTSPIRISAMNLDSNPVATAFRCTTPIKQSEISQDGATQIITYSGSLGSVQKAGVIYLEVSDRLLLKPKSNPELYFKAIRQCLNHCLGLR